MSFNTSPLEIGAYNFLCSLLNVCIVLGVHCVWPFRVPHRGLGFLDISFPGVNLVLLLFYFVFILKDSLAMQAQVGLKVNVILPHTVECRDYRCTPLCLPAGFLFCLNVSLSPTGAMLNNCCIFVSEPKTSHM